MNFLKSLFPKGKEWSDIRVGVWAGIILALLTAIGAFMYGLPALLWNNISSFLGESVALPRWILYPPVIGCFIAIVWFFIKCRKPEFVRKYRSDNINDIFWKWAYDKNNRPINPRSFCYICHTGVTLNSGVTSPNEGSRPFTGAYCPHCNRNFPVIINIESAEQLIQGHILPKIQREIDTEGWKRERIDAGHF